MTCAEVAIKLKEISSVLERQRWTEALTQQLQSIITAVLAKLFDITHRFRTIYGITENKHIAELESIVTNNEFFLEGAITENAKEFVAMLEESIIWHINFDPQSGFEKCKKVYGKVSLRGGHVLLQIKKYLHSEVRIQGSRIEYYVDPCAPKPDSLPQLTADDFLNHVGHCSYHLDELWKTHVVKRVRANMKRSLTKFIHFHCLQIRNNLDHKHKEWPTQLIHTVELFLTEKMKEFEKRLEEHHGMWIPNYASMDECIEGINTALNMKFEELMKEMRCIVKDAYNQLQAAIFRFTRGDADENTL